MASASASPTSLPISVSKITGTACAHAPAAARPTATVKARNLFIRCPRYHTLQYARMHSWIRRRLALALLVCGPLAPEVGSLPILHTNALHARRMPLDNHRGGFASLATVIRRERDGCHDCILLNAGDVAQGSPVSTIFHGLPVFEVVNLLGYDVGTLGNHDFDYGWMQARKFIQIANYPIVSSNVVGAERELFTPKPYVILNVNGLRVAVIGAMTDELKTLTTPKSMEQWHTTPVLATARKYADRKSTRL